MKRFLILLAVLGLALPMRTAQAANLIPLRAGPLTMRFDADNVFLRYINLGPHEILRGINAPVRPHDWSTVAPKVSNLQIDDQGDRFRVSFEVRCLQEEMGVDFRWKGSITGTAAGEIEFRFDGKAHTAFRRNRIGFCILHGPAAAGTPWVLETTDDQRIEGAFPYLVSPHQPAKNLRAITHEVAPGIRARVAFEGEVFEMEDQRNWTDASFKTYCIPLERPYPVALARGDTVSQRVRISLNGKLPDTGTSNAHPVLTLGHDETPLPSLGLQVSAEAEGLSQQQLDRLKALNLDHLRIDLSLSDPSFRNALRRATEQAKALGVSLQIGLWLGDSPDFPSLLRDLETLRPPVSHWLVTGGEPAHYQATRAALDALPGDFKIGVTRITNFVDLNRARPQDKTIEAVGFAINPQIHAFDNASMIETLAIHSDVVNSARHFVGKRPLIIGPVTLCPMWVQGEDPPGGPPPGPFPTYVDQRQGTSFTAAWTLGSIKYLAAAQPHSVTFYETIGWNGLMDLEDVSARPTDWPSQPGELYPVYHLLKAVGEFAGGTVQSIQSSHPLSSEAIALRKGTRQRILIANFSEQAQRVTLRGFGMPREIQLKPHGMARLDQAAD